MGVSSRARAFLRGFTEGITLPLLEILFSFLLVFLTAVLQAVPDLGTTGSSMFNVPLMLLIFGIVNIVQSLFLGMKRMGYAMGYCVGALSGMVIFFGIVERLLAGMFPEIVPRAATATTGIVIIVVVGIILKFVIASGRGGKLRP